MMKNLSAKERSIRIVKNIIKKHIGTANGFDARAMAEHIIRNLTTAKLMREPPDA